MSVRLAALFPFLGLLTAAVVAQEVTHVAYPQRDLLTPFRNPTDVYAPPDALFKLLRHMQWIAESGNAATSFDTNGREVVDDDRWRTARTEVLNKGLDAGNLAQIMRLSRNTADRATAFYAAFLVENVDHVFELIAHIPGEPERQTRERAMPRAIEFLRANLSRTFGQLSDDQKKAARQALPEIGSPAAKSAGIVRAPVDADWLHKITLVPFFQLLDLDDEMDQAQGLWFLKETFTIRPDLALLWLEPALPRVLQLLRSPSAKVREQAIGLVQSVAGPKAAPPPSDASALVAWAQEAAEVMFPPIRNLNDTIVQLLPSPERDAVAAAGVKALEGSALGVPVDGKRKDGTRYRGFRVVAVPDELKVLAIPAGAVVTSVNGAAVTDAASVLATARAQLARAKGTRKLLVEYVLDGESRAIEFRVP
jgi:hypothetical protein